MNKERDRILNLLASLLFQEVKKRDGQVSLLACFELIEELHLAILDRIVADAKEEGYWKKLVDRYMGHNFLKICDVLGIQPEILAQGQTLEGLQKEITARIIDEKIMKNINDLIKKA